MSRPVRPCVEETLQLSAKRLAAGSQWIFLIFSDSENIVIPMDPRLDAATALLVELLRGPGYGLDLIERLKARGREFTTLPQGLVYPALRSLVQQGFLRAWSTRSRGSGRPRRYYEHTPAGLALAESRRAALAAFSSPVTPSRPAGGDAGEMARGIAECFRVSSFAAELVRAGRTRAS